MIRLKERRTIVGVVAILLASVIAIGSLVVISATAAPVDTTFGDGTRAHLDVGAPWWSWIWGGLIYQPARGTVTAVKATTTRVCHWWCLWLCCSEKRVDNPSPVDRIVIEALGYTRNPAGDQVTQQGSATCNNCSFLSHYVHNIGFPVPPWGGGGGFQGIGFRATITHRGEVKVLHDHWGSAGTMPADFL